MGDEPRVTFKVGDEPVGAAVATFETFNDAERAEKGLARSGIVNLEGKVSGRLRAGIEITSVEGYGDEAGETTTWHVDWITYDGDKTKVALTEVL